MLIKIFTLVFSSAFGGFDDVSLQEFLKDKEIISIENHFFTRNEVPYLTLVIQYFPLRQELDSKMLSQGKRDEAWRQTLSEADMGLFNLLRDWRSKRARKEGIPPYVLFTNRQLAQIVKIKPQELVDLARIEGFGQARLDKYGSEILGITKLDLGLEQKNVSGKEREDNVHSREASNQST